MKALVFMTDPDPVDPPPPDASRLTQHLATTPMKIGSRRSLGMVSTECVMRSLSAADGLAVENAMNKSPEPLPE